MMHTISVISDPIMVYLAGRNKTVPYMVFSLNLKLRQNMIGYPLVFIMNTHPDEITSESNRRGQKMRIQGFARFNPPEIVPAAAEIT